LAATSTVAITPDTASGNGRSKAAPAFSVKRSAAGSKPGWVTTTSYGPTRRYVKRNRPAASVTPVAETFVSTCRTTTVAPTTAAPWGSVTRPLTLACAMAS